MHKKPITLIEFLVAICLISASSFLGFSLYKHINKYRFEASVERCALKLSSCRHRAVYTQMDQRITLQKKGKKWILTAISIEEPSKKGEVSTLDFGVLLHNGKEVREMTFEFFSSGSFTPAGVLEFQQGSFRKRLALPKTLSNDNLPA